MNWLLGFHTSICSLFLLLVILEQQSLSCQVAPETAAENVEYKPAALKRMPYLPLHCVAPPSTHRTRCAWLLSTCWVT
jgi:hypothetical protein